MMYRPNPTINTVSEAHIRKGTIVDSNASTAVKVYKLSLPEEINGYQFDLNC